MSDFAVLTEPGSPMHGATVAPFDGRAYRPPPVKAAAAVVNYGRGGPINSSKKSSNEQEQATAALKFYRSAHTSRLGADINRKGTLSAFDGSNLIFDNKAYCELQDFLISECKMLDKHRSMMEIMSSDYRNALAQPSMAVDRLANHFISANFTHSFFLRALESEWATLSATLESLGEKAPHATATARAAAAVENASPESDWSFLEKKIEGWRKLSDGWAGDDSVRPPDEIIDQSVQMLKASSREGVVIPRALLSEDGEISLRWRHGDQFASADFLPEHGFLAFCRWKISQEPIRIRAESFSAADLAPFFEALRAFGSDDLDIA